MTAYENAIKTVAENIYRDQTEGRWNDLTAKRYSEYYNAQKDLIATLYTDDWDRVRVADDVFDALRELFEQNR